MDYGWLSLIPVGLATALAFKTRRVNLSLLTGIFAGSIIISLAEKSPGAGLTAATSVIANPDTLMSISFCLMIGGLIYLLDVSGGVEGVVIQLSEKRKMVRNGIGAQLMGFILGVVLCVDGTSSIVISGITARPFFDKHRIPREKLAYISDSTSAPVAWLFPMAGAGAFLMALLGGQVSSGVIHGNPMTYIFQAIPYQLYSLISVAIVALTILTGREMGKMEQVFADTSIKKGPKPSYKTRLPCGKVPRAINMLAPLGLLVTTIFTLFYITGGGCITNGNGSVAIPGGVISTIFFTITLYWFQKIAPLGQLLRWAATGMGKFFPVTMILVFAFGLSGIMAHMDTGAFIARICSGISPALLPAMIFLTGSVISFGTGTSGGTAAIMIPVAIPTAVSLGVPIPICIGAVISGAVFGDHCSPISDSSILSAMAAEVDVMDHISTQLPYAILGAILTTAGFIALGHMNL